MRSCLEPELQGLQIAGTIVGLIVGLCMTMLGLTFGLTFGLFITFFGLTLGLTFGLTFDGSMVKGGRRSTFDITFERLKGQRV